jgi:aldehyde dehydrogenase (NAD+)
MTTREIFDTMDYGPAPESDAEVRAWIATRGPAFGHFIDGRFTGPGGPSPRKTPQPATPLPRSRKAPPTMSTPP